MLAAIVIRRTFLGSAAAAGVSAAIARIARPGETMLRQLTVPLDLATPVEAFDRLITPTRVFFVRSHFPEPALERRRRLRVEGARRTLDLGVDDLRRFKETSVTAVLQCAGNGRGLHDPHVPGLQWIHGAMGQAEWTGVRLGDVLDDAGLPADAAHVRVRGADLPPQPTVPKFIRSLPLARALDPETLIATRMNGAPLTLVHGAPMRLVVPRWTGQHWVKWLKEVRAQREEAEGFYYQTGYRMPRAPVAPGTAVKPADTVPLTTFPVKSVIARPANGTRLPPGRVEVVGVAFSGNAPITRVELSTDGGNHWNDARREGVAAPGRWQVFRYALVGLGPGLHRVIARASDGRGNVQPARASWNPSGYVWNAWHEVSFTVGP